MRPKSWVAVLGLACLLPAWGIVENPASRTQGESEWPQFGGPDRNGSVQNVDIAFDWPETGLEQRWAREIGGGFSGVTVADGMLYTMYAAGDSEYVAGYDAATGEKRWSRLAGVRFDDVMGNGPRSTPTVDGAWLFALGAKGNLMALDRKTGALHWQVALDSTLEGKPPFRGGFCTSPLIVDDLVMVDVGGGEGKAVAAFDKSSGELVWSRCTAKGSYASPIDVTIGGARQLVFVTGGHAVALNSAGDSLWTHRLPPGIIAMPLFVPPNGLFFSGSSDRGCAMIRLDAQDDVLTPTLAWGGKMMKNHFSSSVYHDGYLYGFSNSTLTCVNATSGERKWSKRGYGKGSLLLVNDHLLILSDRGRLALARATPNEFKERSGFQALKGKCWTAPTVAGGAVYLRNQTQLVSFKL